MRKFSRIIALVLCAILSLSFYSCSNSTQENDTTAPAVESPVTEELTEIQKLEKPVNVLTLKGPTGMGLIDLMDNENYNISIVSDPTTIAPAIIKGEADIACCPLSLAANLYKKTEGKIQIINISTLGTLYLLSSDGSIKSVADLKGKTVYATGKDSTPQYILDYLFTENGISNDVTVEYLSEHTELATKMISGDVDIAILPEPFVSLVCSKTTRFDVANAVSLTDEWNKVDSETPLSMGCTIARKDFIDNNPEALNLFINDSKKSVENVNNNPYDEMLKMIDKELLDASLLKVSDDLSESEKLQAQKELANGTISRCNIVYFDGANIQKYCDANFKVYFDADPKSIGGAMPSAELYYEAK